MRKNKIAVLMLVICIAALALCGCGKSETPKNNSGSGNLMDNIPKDSDYGVNTLKLGGYTVTAEMDEIMANGSDLDHYEGDRDATTSGRLGFITNKPNNGGDILITGSIYLGSAEELFDFNIEDFYSDEDFMKVAEDPDYVPAVTLPTVTEMMELSMSAFGVNKLESAKISDIDMTIGKGHMVLDSGKGMIQYLAYGQLDGMIIYIDVSADIIDCEDTESLIESTEELINNWLQTISISKS